MMKARFIALVGVAAGLFASVSNAAFAQSVTNQAWIGQTGETNTISIIQEGNSNRAGADNTTHRINQDGRYNTLSIDQFGWSNAAGADELGAPLPEGLNQIGDRNSVSINQHDVAQNGFNFLGSVLQLSYTQISTLANMLVVAQSEVGGGGQAGHSIRAVTQIKTRRGQDANRATLTQTGGGDALGNTIGQFIQFGFANIADVIQSASRNNVAFAGQQGDHNKAGIAQGGGKQNTINVLNQFGMNNTVDISQSGNRNHTAWVLQNNQGVAISGNRMKITIAGDDNGGDNQAGPGSFKSSVLLSSRVFQGGFVQIGDDNDATYTVNGGHENLAGIAQFGRGNGAVVAIGPDSVEGPDSAARNEVGIFQNGDDNNLSLGIIGKENVSSVSMDGDRNKLALSQSGSGNVFDISILGNDNNSDSPSVGGFRDRLVMLAFDANLSPGTERQIGISNVVKVGLLGDSNLFAIKQQGHDNNALLVVNGTANQALIDQSKSSSQAQIKQSGTGNSMAVVQF